MKHVFFCASFYICRVCSAYIGMDRATHAVQRIRAVPGYCDYLVCFLFVIIVQRQWNALVYLCSLSVFPRGRSDLCSYAFLPVGPPRPRYGTGASRVASVEMWQSSPRCAALVTCRLCIPPASFGCYYTHACCVWLRVRVHSTVRACMCVRASSSLHFAALGPLVVPGNRRSRVRTCACSTMPG